MIFQGRESRGCGGARERLRGLRALGSGQAHNPPIPHNSGPRSPARSPKQIQAVPPRPVPPGSTYLLLPRTLGHLLLHLSGCLLCAAALFLFLSLLAHHAGSEATPGHNGRRVSGVSAQPETRGALNKGHFLSVPWHSVEQPNPRVLWIRQPS